MIIRAGTTGDSPFIERVHRDSIRGTPAGFYSRAELESWASGLHVDRYIWGMTFGGERYLLAEVDGEGGNLAGFCSWRQDFVKGLYIHPDWIGCGVGTALMDLAEVAMIGSGIASIRLNASAMARPLYEKRGYRIIRRREWKTRGGLVMEACDMEKPVGR